MKKTLYLIAVFVAVVSIAGCITVEKVVRERIDQQPTGNRGYIKGTAPPRSHVAKSKTREYIDVRIEIPTFGEVAGGHYARPAKPKGVSRVRKDIPAVERPAPTVYIPPPAPTREVKRTAPAVKRVQPALHPGLYKVKEGDSLGRIAKRFYGKASKWTLIYEANIDKIKDPQRIRPGIELIIPRVEEEEKYIK